MTNDLEVYYDRNHYWFSFDNIYVLDWISHNRGTAFCSNLVIYSIAPGFNNRLSWLGPLYYHSTDPVRD